MPMLFGKSLFFRFQQLVILIAHLVLLKWMWFTLNNAGVMTTTEVCLHFLGVGLFGAFLIRFCAWWARGHYIRELEQEAEAETGNEK